MIGHCKDCRFWERSGLDRVDWLAWTTSRGWCSAIDEIHYDLDGANAAHTVVVFRSDASLLTAPDFGCVLFEAVATAGRDGGETQ